MARKTGRKTGAKTDAPPREKVAAERPESPAHAERPESPERAGRPEHAEPPEYSGRVEDVDISGVMQSSYRDYAAAVVVGRAIADVRDGLKPVHRRILYTMKLGRYDWTANHRKTARIVGDCMGALHPHGDTSIAEALARMTQPWSMSLPLIDGQGNFGSPDGDGPAAMRYTEARLAPVSRFLLEEIDRDTVDWRPNYDETEKEPVVLPAAFPNALVNGGSGIAVGMAAALPPHNLSEVIDATLLRLGDPEISLPGLMRALPGPDFPTGGRVLGNGGILKAYETGRGTLDIEASTHFEREGRNPLVVYTDMPWGVTRPAVLARINQMITDGQLAEVVSARDETGRTGPRFVVELRPGVDPEQVDRVLKTQTALRTGVSLNFTLLDGHGVPREMGLATILDEWIGFRRQTVRRRAAFDLRKARDRGRLLLGRVAALSVIDRIVRLIRAAKDREQAIAAIRGLSFSRADFPELVDLLGTRGQRKGKRFQLERVQAEDILAMRLQRLTGMERESLEEEARGIVARMQELREILSDPARLDRVIAEELEAVRATAPVQDRRTVIDAGASRADARAAAPVAPREDTWLIETPEGTFARSGKGLPAEMEARATPTDTHSRLVFFTDHGISYAVAVSDLPALEARQGPRPVPGLLGLTPVGEVIAALALSPDDTRDAKDAKDAKDTAGGGAILSFVSEDGMIRRSPASEFARIPQPGKVAMKIDVADPRLLSVFRETDSGGAVFLGTAGARVIRFAAGDVRVMAGRSSRGVRAIKLEGDDRVVSAFEVPDRAIPAELCDEVEKGWLGRAAKKTLSGEAAALLGGPEIVQVAVTGHARRTPLAAYRQTRRDNRGVNDRGPAGTIGAMAGFALLAPGQETLRVRTAEGVRTLAAGGLRKGARATTGAIDADGATGLF